LSNFSWGRVFIETIPWFQAKGSIDMNPLMFGNAFIVNAPETAKNRPYHYPIRDHIRQYDLRSDITLDCAKLGGSADHVLVVAGEADITKLLAYPERNQDAVRRTLYHRLLDTPGQPMSESDFFKTTKATLEQASHYLD
jgi:hypothetical protein